jgi:hypothetical protein
LPRLRKALDAMAQEVGRERELDAHGFRRGPDREELESIRLHLHKHLPRLAADTSGETLRRVLETFLQSAHRTALAEQRATAIRHIAEAHDPNFARVRADQRAWAREAIAKHNAMGEEAFVAGLESGQEPLRAYPQFAGFTTEQLAWAEHRYRGEDTGPYPAAARPYPTATPFTAEQIVKAGRKARGEVIELPADETARAILRAGRRARGEEQNR